MSSVQKISLPFMEGQVRTKMYLPGSLFFSKIHLPGQAGKNLCQWREDNLVYTALKFHNHFFWNFFVEDEIEVMLSVPSAFTKKGGRPIY